MGDDYLALSKLWTERQQVPVEYVGLEDCGTTLDRHAGQAAFINSRGSIEQALAGCMVGPPHDEHHRSDKLDWMMDHTTAGVFRWLMAMFYRLLRPGGIVLIHANGTRTKKSREWYDKRIQIAAKQVGLELVDRDERSKRLHKWVKTDSERERD